MVEEKCFECQRLNMLIAKRHIALILMTHRGSFHRFDNARTTSPGCFLAMDHCTLRFHDRVHRKTTAEFG